MPDSAPEEYKKLAERCCDADLDKQLEDGNALYLYIGSDNFNSDTLYVCYLLGVEDSITGMENKLNEKVTEK